MPAVRGDGMRGLAVFISDIRNCKSKEAEIKRINKEKNIINIYIVGEISSGCFWLRACVFCHFCECQVVIFTLKILRKRWRKYYLVQIFIL